MMIGRFYAGKDSLVKAQDFKVSMIHNNSPIVKSIKNKGAAQWDYTETSLQLNHLQKHMHLKTAMFSPIITKRQVIGMYFIARAAHIPFSEKEIAWFEQIVIYVGQAFENSQKQK